MSNLISLDHDRAAEQARINEQRKLNIAAQSIETPKVFLDKFPDLKREKADKLFRRYLDVVMAELIDQLRFLKDGLTHISTQKLFDKCSRFRVKGKSFHVWNEFKDIYPLIVVISKGSNVKPTDKPYEKNTLVRVVNERFLAMLLEEKAPKTVFDHFYKNEDLDQPGVATVPIDMENVERFIGNCLLKLEDATATKLREKLQSNLWQAKLVHKIGQHTEAETGEAFLPMVPSPSPFGRTYYKGLNIQNVSKQVRSAIIGRHYQYDMNAAVYAIKLLLYGIINGGDNNLIHTPKGTYTREYLRRKNEIRNRLARACFAGTDIPHETALKAIKNALTAIGFGAKTGANFYPTQNGMKATALGEIILSPDARAAFERDPWVKAFIAEQKEIETDIITNRKARPEFEEIAAVVRGANGTNGKLTNGGLLAYYFQQLETSIMDIAIDVLAQFNIQPIARIHDAFIVRDKLPTRVMDEIADAWDHRDYLSLDCEEVGEWMDPEFKRSLMNADAEAAAHHHFIANEEAKAQKKAALKRAGWQ